VYLLLRHGGDQRQVLGHVAIFDGIDGSLLQSLGKFLQLGQVVQFASLIQSAGQAKIVATELVEVSLPSRC
jgi:hypothetical protein